jgi:hypothetical protein
MPLLDHFRPPLSVQRPWEGVHGSWASAIASKLNEQLPPDYFAMPLVSVGGQVEVDVGAFREDGAAHSDEGAVKTAVWAPPKPLLTTAIDWAAQDAYEVHVFQEMGGPKLRGAIELVSPSNKDRPSHRRAFAIKCAAYLQNGIGVIVVDVVSERQANLHAELIELLRLPDLSWKSPTNLYAVSYRSVPSANEGKVEAWPEVLQVGQALPTSPLWLDNDLCLPLNLEESYVVTCSSLRIAV